jgi:thiamine-phosphate pyrophosphorylase
MTGVGPGTHARPDGPLPRLHVVTDDSMLARGDFEARAVAVLEAGGPAVALHLRGPRTDGSALYRLASTLLPYARRSGTRLFVNDRLDVAIALQIDGVHVGHRSLGVRVARGLLGPGPWLGASVHDGKEASAAREEGADYAFLGTMFETPTHPGRVGMGIEGLTATVGRVGELPIVAIGGIDPARAAEVLGAGAYGVAVVRGVWDSRDAPGAVRRYRQAIDEATEAV